MNKGDKFNGYTFDGNEWWICDTCGHKAAGIIPMASHAGKCFMKEALLGLKELAKQREGDLSVNDISNFLDDKQIEK